MHIMAALYLALSVSSTSPDTTVVGSGTVAPLAEIVVQRLKPEDIGGTVGINATGSNKGFELFCSSTDPAFAPVTLASRKFDEQDLAGCSAALQAKITEVELGVNVLTLITNRRGPLAFMNLNREDVFLAFASRVPQTDGSCRLVANPHQVWSDIRADLPEVAIDAFGPGKTSGTHSSFMDLVMVEGAKANTCMRKLDAEDPGVLKRTAKTLRTDGKWTVAPEDDVEVVAHLHHNTHVVSVVGYTAARRFGRHVSMLKIEGTAPDPGTVASRNYRLVGKLYMYTNESAVAKNGTARAFVDAITADAAIGENGFLVPYGLIPIGD